MATDLTWQQLQNVINVDGAITYDATDGILIKISAITGDNYANMNATGVIEAMAKLFSSCYSAQIASNASAPIGARLNAFAQPSFGVPTVDTTGAYFTTATYTMQARNPVDLNISVGVQI